MSHFSLGVILPKSFDPSLSAEDINAYLNAVMKPFDEQHSVPPYLKSCYCIGHLAHRRARAYADVMTGEAESVRNFYWQSRGTEQEAIADELWQSRFETIQDRLAYDPDQFAPDPDCDDCHGSGQMESTYNPRSKWDWWVIGGRWDGEIQRNKRSDGKGNYGSEHHLLKYNASIVKKLLPPIESPIDANLIDTSTEIIAAQNRNLVTFFAVLTPDGEWIERGDMGWWGIVAGEKHDSDWNQDLINIYNRYLDHLIIGLDCHI